MMNIVMTVTIHLKAILMVGIAVHLIQLQIGINIVKDVNAFSQKLQQSLQLLLLKIVTLLQVVPQNT
jgi:hypothetical protein